MTEQGRGKDIEGGGRRPNRWRRPWHPFAEPVPCTAAPPAASPFRTLLLVSIAIVSVLAMAPRAALSAAPSRSTPALNAFERALAPVIAYSATISIFEAKGGSAGTTVSKYTFRKPSTVTVDVVGGPNDGASLLWKGGDTVSVRRGAGLVGLFGKTLPLHDPLVTTSRGSSIDEISFGRILEHGRAMAGRITEKPGPTIGAVPTVTVTLIPSDAASNSGYTRETIDISTATHLPLRILGYDGPNLVRKIDFADVRLTR